MAEEKIQELRQEEVFAYIDRELKKFRTKASPRITQKTRKNFVMVIAIDLLAAAIAVAGLYGIYGIFKAREINLVGNERSIKGLEDVLFQEIRKKASADLTQKQQELEDAKGRLTLLNNQMDSIKKDQEKLVQERLEKVRKEMNTKLESDLKNKTEKEKAEIRKLYEEQLKTASKTVEQDTAKELQKRRDELARLQTEKDKLESASKKRQQEMEKSQTELQKSNEDLQKQLAETQKARGREMEQLTAGVEEKKKRDLFNDQVNTLFRAAITAYGKKDFNSVRDRLVAVERLYQNRPKDVIIAAEKEDVDRFFLDTLRDYLSIKENTQNPDQKKYQDVVVALQGLKDLGLQLSRGDYRGRKTEAEAKMADYRKSVPEVFDFFRGYDAWRAAGDDNAVATLLKTADSLYDVRDFKGAATRYVGAIKQFPSVANRADTLDKLNNSIMSLEGIGGKKQMEIDLDEVNSNAAPVFKKANDALARNETDAALSGFQSVLLNYPNSKYGKDSLQVIRAIYQDRLALAFTNAAKSIKEQEDRKTEVENRKAAQLYKEGSAFLARKDYGSAFDRYRRVLTEYPRSGMLKDAADGMQLIMEGRIASIPTNTVPTNAILVFREVQDSNAQGLYADAVKLEAAGEFETARKAYLRVVVGWPFSKYVKDAAAALERTAENETKNKVEEASPIRLSEEQLVSFASGRVVDVRDDEVGMNLAREDGLTNGTYLLVYRRLGNGKFLKTGEIQVMDLTGFIKRARIISKTGEVRAGDLLYGK